MSQYPQGLRNIMKATPSWMLFFGMATTSFVFIYNWIYHANDRIPKVIHRSPAFERFLRNRDDKLRNSYQFALTWDPNTTSIG